MSPSDDPGHRLDARELAALRPLARQFPNLDAALAEIARLSGELTLPKETVHVISDIHGEYAKLRHVINNASGTLRPLVERLFADKLSEGEIQDFLTLIFYPKETMEAMEPALRDPDARRDFCRRTLSLLFAVVRSLAGRGGHRRALRVFPDEYRDLLQELLHAPSRKRGPKYFGAIVDALSRHDRALHVIRLTVRALRNLAIDELVIAGDCWDRGPRGDRVVDYLTSLPNVSFVWGNHDAAWIGAGLGQEALIAQVLRISMRYRRLSQLEEGYGITVQPLEHLVRAVYAEDPADCFSPRGHGLRDPLMMARMQKAAAILQFKLEGQSIERHPEWGLDRRRLLHRIDFPSGTIKIDGIPRQLKDTHFPTISPEDPYALSAEERACMDRIRQSFVTSHTLDEHIHFLVERGAMSLVRDGNLIFHGCVPVDARGEFLSMEVDGVPRRGRALFEAIERVVARSLNNPTESDRDLFWYLWCGPNSPLFGKNRIATLEVDLVADPATHVEFKNPYFHLIHEASFCERILAEFGVDPERGLIVNGHVPVAVESGESPLKRGGKAITIDGAFSAAYGDHGFTLLLEPDRTALATHHHFESVEAAVRDGVDIIPTITDIRQWDPPRRVTDTERGEEILREIETLERLVAAYRANRIRQTPAEPLGSL